MIHNNSLSFQIVDTSIDKVTFDKVKFEIDRLTKILNPLSQEKISLASCEKKLRKALVCYNQTQQENPNFAEYGNKGKNLFKLDDLFTALNINWIRVPRPRGLKNSQAQQFLFKHSSQICDIWKNLGKLYSESEKSNAFFSNQKVKDNISALEALIQRPFQLASGDENVFKALDSELVSWLDIVRKNGNYLMVRSSGSEDSKNMANAGGNVSVAYVSPTRTGFCAAGSEVECSYVNQRSLQNQINCGQNPFDKELKLALITQELIGEEIGGKSNNIPRSAVLFTNEPLYVGTEKFRVMRLSCTYGHGEAIVQNLGIASDTILILHSLADPGKLFILYDNQPKKMRLAPMEEDGKIVLKKITNDPSLVYERVFDDDMLAKIYQLGVISEAFFEDDATDMELVVKDGIIYPVQARPVVRPELLPTYIDFKKLSEDNVLIEDTFRTTLQVCGQASVISITKPEEILIAQSLKEIDDNRLFIQGQHKLVVVALEDAANTHPVVNFSGYGIPCLISEMGQDPVKELVSKIDDTHQLAVCVQSGAINLWDTSKANVANYTSKGFVIHPAKILHSFTPKKLAKKPIKTEIAKEVQELLFQLCTEKTQLEGLKIHEWLKLFTERQQALTQEMLKTPFSKRAIQPILVASNELINKINATFKELSTCFQQNNENRLHPLFFAKTLETLFYSNKGSNGQYSIVNMESHFAAAEEQLSYQRELKFPAHFIHELMYGFECPVPHIFEEWKKFLLELEPLAKDFSEFKRALNFLKESGVMPWFMTIIFTESAYLPSLERMHAITNLLPESEAPLVNDLLEQKNNLQMLLLQTDAFQDPKTFKQAFDNLKQVLENFSAKSKWESNSNIIKVMTVENMNLLVELYDTAIKSMKASLNFSSDFEKTKIFKEMLLPYFSLLKNWTLEILGTNSFPMNERWTEERMLNTIFERLQGMSETNAEQLLPSRDFSVSAAAFGAGTAFERHYPVTLEDVFTLIHQNLLAVTAKLLNQLLSDDQIAQSPMPRNLKTALTKTPQVGGNGVGVPQRIGIEIKQDVIIFHYNVPLRNHSGRFSLRYSDSKTTMDAQFLGQARTRWSDSADILNFYDQLIGIASSAPKITANELTFSFKLDQEQIISTAMEIYKINAVRSLEGPEPSQLITEHLIELGLVDKAITVLFNMNKQLPFEHAICAAMLGNIWDNGNNPDSIEIPNFWFNDNNLKLNFFKKHFEKSFEIIQEAESTFLHPGSTIDLTVALLYCRSIRQGKKYLMAIQAVKNEMAWQVMPTVQSERILANLLEKGVAIELASLYMNNLLQNISSWNFLVVSRFCKAFLSQNLYSEVEAVLQKLFLSDNSVFFNNNDITYLIDKLFEKGLGVEWAEKTAQDFLLSNDPLKMNATKMLYEKLFAKGIGYTSAVSGAKKGVFGNYSSQQLALWVFDQLFKLKMGHQEASDVAASAIFSSDLMVASTGFNLYEKLFAAGLGFDAAKYAAKAACSSKDFGIKNTGFRLYEKLIESGHGYEETLDEICSLTYLNKKKAFQVFYRVLYLFETLFKKDIEIERCHQLAKQAFASDDKYLKQGGLSLYGKLIPYMSSAFEEIEKALEEALQSDDDALKKCAEDICRDNFKDKLKCKSQLIMDAASKEINFFW